MKFDGERKKLETSVSNLSLQRDMLQQQLKETRIDLKKRLDEVHGLQKVVSDDQVEKENLENNVKKLQNVITRYRILFLCCFEALAVSTVSGGRLNNTKQTHSRTKIEKSL